MANLTPNTVKGGLARPQMPQRQGLVSPMGMMGGGAQIPPVPSSPGLGTLGGLVKAHTITISPDGTQKHSVTHDIEGKSQKKESTGLVGKASKPTQQPAIKFENGMHHIPFMKEDGTHGYINAHGQTH